MGNTDVVGNVTALHAPSMLPGILTASVVGGDDLVLLDLLLEVRDALAVLWEELANMYIYIYI